MSRRERRRRRVDSSGKQAWLWLATTAGWFTGACVAWVIVDLSLGVFDYDRSDTMTAWIVTFYAGPFILLVVMANFMVTVLATGLPRWARATSLAVALLLALVSGVGFALLVAR